MERRETSTRKRRNHHRKEAGFSYCRRPSNIIPGRPRDIQGHTFPLRPARLGKQGRAELEVQAPRGETAGMGTESDPCPPGARLDCQPTNFQLYPSVSNFGLPRSSSRNASPFLTPSFPYSSDPEGQLVWAGNSPSPLQPKPPQGALLWPPSSYPTRWESSCRLWAHRKLALGAGMGGGGAAVMSRETDDNRQTDGTGARGCCASNAHQRPSFGARQSGTQSGIPRERWSRVRGPQLRNLTELKETSGLVGLHLGKRRRDTCPGVGAGGAEESSSTGQTLAASLTGEAASTQGREMATVATPKLLFRWQCPLQGGETLQTRLGA